jgi:hypothetical protein
VGGGCCKGEMKFGQYLRDSAVPAWRSQYINYKKLKQIVKKFPSTSKSKQFEEKKGLNEPVNKLFNNGVEDEQPVHSRRNSNASEGSDSLGSAVDDDKDFKLKVKIDAAMAKKHDSSTERSDKDLMKPDEESKSLLDKDKNLAVVDPQMNNGNNGDNVAFNHLSQPPKWATPNLHLDISPELLDMFHKSNRRLQPHMLTSIQLIEDPSTQQKMIVQVPHAFPHIADPSIRLSHKTTQERVSPETYFQVDLRTFIPEVWHDFSAHCLIVPLRISNFMMSIKNLCRHCKWKLESLSGFIVNRFCILTSKLVLLIIV